MSRKRFRARATFAGSIPAQMLVARGTVLLAQHTLNQFMEPLGTGIECAPLRGRRPKRGQMRFIIKKPTAEERLNAARIRDHIGHLLKNHYQACVTNELPPRLVAALKKLDEEQPELSGEER